MRRDERDGLGNLARQDALLCEVERHGLADERGLGDARGRHELVKRAVESRGDEYVHADVPGRGGSGCHDFNRTPSRVRAAGKPG